MQELVQQNKKNQLTNKWNSYQKNIPNMNNYLILPQLSTFNEKDLKPYWNQRCQELQQKLWLPHKIESQGQDLHSSNGLSNYTEEKSLHWKRTLKPKNNLIQKNLSVLLPASATHTTGKGQQLEENLIKTSKKVRFYPKNEEKYFQALSLYRRAYNLTIAKFKDNLFIDKDGEFINLRPEIKELCKKEQVENEKIYNSIIVDNAVLSAQKTIKIIMKKNKGGKNGYHQARFKSKKGDIHSFAIDRMPKGLNPVVRVLGKISLSEKMPTINVVVKKMCSCTFYTKIKVQNPL